MEGSQSDSRVRCTTSTALKTGGGGLHGDGRVLGRIQYTLCTTEVLHHTVSYRLYTAVMHKCTYMYLLSLTKAHWNHRADVHSFSYLHSNLGLHRRWADQNWTVRTWGGGGGGDIEAAGTITCTSHAGYLSLCLRPQCRQPV